MTERTIDLSSPSTSEALRRVAVEIPSEQLPAPEILSRLSARVAKEVIGYEWVVRLLYIAVVAEGHVLLEGAPGIAKTLLVRRFADNLALDFKRIQFTPDMLPSDIIGNVVLNPATDVLEYRRGPVFTNVLLADEINRAPPKVQSALLEAMQERQVTMDGVTYPLPRPFLVIATENPIEQEGTYPLPEAQLDRLLFRILLDYPSESKEQELVRRHIVDSESDREPPVADALTVADHRRRANDVFVSEDVVAFIARLIRATRGHASIALGASPRAGVQLGRAAKVEALLEGRNYVAPEDVRKVVFWALNHRVSINPEMMAEAFSRGNEMTPTLRKILWGILDRVEAPR